MVVWEAILCSALTLGFVTFFFEINKFHFPFLNLFLVSGTHLLVMQNVM